VKKLSGTSGPLSVPLQLAVRSAKTATAGHERRITVGR
jgi:hypothetical protein